MKSPKMKLTSVEETKSNEKSMWLLAGDKIFEPKKGSDPISQTFYEHREDWYIATTIFIFFCLILFGIVEPFLMGLG